MHVMEKPISIADLVEMARHGFGEMVKAVVDVERGIMAVDAELHSDEEALLIAAGSRQEDLWGINIYPELPEGERIEFDSMINLRPTQGNRTRGVDDAATRARIVQVVNNLVHA